MTKKTKGFYLLSGENLMVIICSVGIFYILKFIYPFLLRFWVFVVETWRY